MRLIEKIKKFFTRELKINIVAFYIMASIFVLFMLDISRLPDEQITTKVLLFSIKQYQRFISPNLKGFIKCKFEPSCSKYGYQSIETYGAFWGTLKTAERLSRCTPWSDSSGWDPP